MFCWLVLFQRYQVLMFSILTEMSKNICLNVWFHNILQLHEFAQLQLLKSSSKAHIPRKFKAGEDSFKDPSCSSTTLHVPMTSAIQQYWRHTMKYAIAVIIAPRMNRMTATAIARQWQGRGQQLYSHSAHPPTHSPPYPLCFLVLGTDFFSPIPGCLRVNYNLIQAPQTPPPSS